MKLLVFIEGTVLMHKTALGHTREEIIKQIKEKEPSVKEYDSYIPIGAAVQKMNHWVKEGHEIWYITSRTKQEEIGAIKSVLQAYHFPGSENLVFRKEGDSYADVVERILPDVLIEDDCESIGQEEIIYLTLRHDIQSRMESVIVKEFRGIDQVIL